MSWIDNLLKKHKKLYDDVSEKMDRKEKRKLNELLESEYQLAIEEHIRGI